MRYQIIIPSFKGHYSQLERSFASFAEFLMDANEVVFYIIVSTEEIRMFEKLARTFEGRLRITVVSLKSLLEKEEGAIVNEQSLLEQVGKFNFQSLKKIYGVKHFGTDLSLVLDSEAFMLRKASMGAVFEAYKKDPYIIHASCGNEQIKQDVARVSFELLGKPFQDIWFFEHYYWFFEKNRVDELFAYILQSTGKTLFSNLLYRKPIFEYNLYCLFLYLFHTDEYRFIEVGGLLKKYLDPQILKRYTEAVGGTPSFEYCAWGLTKENSESFSKMFSDLHMDFFRYDDRQGDAGAQIAFLESNPHIFLLTSMMVTKPFSIDGTLVSANMEGIATAGHGSNAPVIQTAVKKCRSFIRKARFKLKEIWNDAWYQMILPLKLDREAMILRYTPKSGAITIDPDLAFDVGAYTGTSLTRMRALGYRNVVCFEPSGKTFARLYRKYRNDRGVSYVRRAVSDVSGNTIVLYENSATPTLTSTTEGWFDIPRHKGLVRGVTARRVRTITLDNAIELLGVIPSYIKVDVEGHELSVLQGLHHKPMMLSFEWISERKEHNIKALEYVRDLGFTKFYLMKEESLPTYAPETERSFDEVIAEWNRAEQAGTGAEGPWGNIWCR